MVRKFYPEAFKADAVELYSSTPGATIKKIAADLGVHEGTLCPWPVRGPHWWPVSSPRFEVLVKSPLVAM